MASPLIVVSDLEKTYTTKGRALVKALAGISVDIENGEFVTIVGRGNISPLRQRAPSSWPPSP